jgi:hypothetical protein
MKQKSQKCHIYCTNDTSWNAIFHAAKGDALGDVSVVRRMMKILEESKI